ncbi:hypothetical protein RRF57_012804 [Xylaria bambusicola]|uniref:Uncharacterized protein n=1 Tax=Xylaria bambusicola TaxID=326684 RepID=A0AAN7UVU4_9PEZI
MPTPKESGISASFISHLRQSSRISCPIPCCNNAYPAINDRIRNHFRSKHGNIIQGKDRKDIAAFIHDVKKGRHLGGGVQGMSDEAGASCKQRKSLVNSPLNLHKLRSNNPLKRSKARPPQNNTPADPDFLQKGPQQGELWNPEEDPTSSPYRAKQKAARPPKGSAPLRRVDAPEEDSKTLWLIRQPKTRPISQKQLKAKVKGIYIKLIMVKFKYIKVNNAQSF